MESGLDCSVCLFFCLFFGYVGLLGGSSCVGVDRSQIINIFLLLNQTYILSNVRPELFIFYSCHCSSLCVIFIYYNRHSYFYLLYLIFKRIFHLGGLVSKMHTSGYMSFTEWECFCFSSFTKYNFGFKNIQCIL